MFDPSVAGQVFDFICTKSVSDYCPVGTIVKGRRTGAGGFHLAATYCKLSAAFRKGLYMPMRGELWEWEIHS